MSERKIESGRYLKRAGYCLDHDGSKYTNGYSIFDGDTATGISMSDSGDSNVPGSNKRTIIFHGQEYPLLRDAIIAYEDSAVSRPLRGDEQI